jgi:hypothetical protein
MDVSIIIINYNTLEYTLSCLTSIYKYSSSFSFEIILIDNASSYFHEELIRSRFNQVKVIANKINVGFSKAVNQGIQQSSGEYILLMNNDILLIENSIFFCLEFLKSNQQYGFLSPKITYPDGKIQPVANSFPSIKIELLQLFRLTKILPGHYLSKALLGKYFDHQISRQVDWVWGTFLLFPRKLLREFDNHLLPDYFFLYYEDVLWCYMAFKKGYRTYYLADTSVIHHMSKSLSENSELKNNRIMKNEKIFMIREKGAFYAAIYFIIKGLVYLSQKQKHLRKLGIKYLRYFST